MKKITLSFHHEDDYPHPILGIDSNFLIMLLSLLTSSQNQRESLPTFWYPI